MMSGACSVKLPYHCVSKRELFCVEQLPEGRYLLVYFWHNLLGFHRGIVDSSSVGIATRYGLDWPGIESRWGARFCAPVQTGPGAYPCSYTMGTGSFPGVKRPRRCVDHPPPSSAKVEGRVELYICSPSGPSWPVVGRTLPFLPRLWEHVSVQSAGSIFSVEICVDAWVVPVDGFAFSSGSNLDADSWYANLSWFFSVTNSGISAMS